VNGAWERLPRLWNRFLFEGGDPRLVAIFRIGYGILLLINVSIWLADSSRWFSDDGMLTAATAAHLYPRQYLSLFFVIPSTDWLVHGCLLLLGMQAILLLLGCWSRFQAACIFFWLVSFQHRNPLICDGEDTVFRLFAFFMIWMPLDDFLSLRRSWLRRNRPPALLSPQSALVSPPSPTVSDPSRAWALRLVQVEMTLIYLSAALAKLGGESWQNGTALYYVAQMDDHFGRIFIPEFLFTNLWCVRMFTWASLGIECWLPFGLWFPKTRRLSVMLGLLLHLSIELTMHLFLFEWIMMLGLITFLRPNELGWIAWGPPRRSPTPTSAIPATGSLAPRSSPPAI
jgi:hypothetical protein